MHFPNCATKTGLVALRFLWTPFHHEWTEREDAKQTLVRDIHYKHGNLSSLCWFYSSISRQVFKKL